MVKITPEIPWYKQMGVHMVFRPKSLSSGWYIQDVLKHIIASLEGVREIGSSHIDNKHNRAYYVETVNKCIDLCSKSYSSYAMLAELRQLKADIHYSCPPNIFSIKRWTSSPIEYKEKAVDDCLDLIEGIHKRYLVHD